MASEQNTIDIEDQAPLTGVRSFKRGSLFRGSCLVLTIALLTAIVATLSFVLANEVKDLNSKYDQLAQSQTSNTAAPKNIIFFVTDGMGPAQVTLARNILRDKVQDDSVTLQIDPLQVGSTRTRALNTLITDSAAGATAFASGVKTKNFRIGVDGNDQAIGTLMEAAMMQSGMATGVVVTKAVTDATPASFTSHTVHRANEELIALQQSTKGLSVIFGGGTKYFNQRKDGQNLLANMQNSGYEVLTTVQGLRGPLPKAPVIGLFTTDDMSYEIDRNNSVEPSLSEMTQRALDIISASSQAREKGFFLMVEASQIDIACHDNDASAFIAELLEWDKTVKIAKDFQAMHPDTLIVSMSDHETGGLTLSSGAFIPKNTSHYAPEGSIEGGADTPHETMAESFDYNQNLPTQTNSNISLYDLEMRYYYVLSPFESATTSLRYVNSQIVSALNAGQDPNLASLLKTSLNLTLSPAEQILMDAAMNRQRYLTANSATLTLSDSYYNAPIRFALVEIIAARAGIAWSTKGHSGVDCYLYASGPGAPLFFGSHENTDVTALFSKLMGWNIPAVTATLAGVDVGTCPYTDQRCG